ncbi:MAG TPA: hypothetical protein VMF07_03840, partial [Solirubrobacteraceae bacterium]|nr:hypothetical protein [Solirubrobacteraceae bacterium]
MQLTARCWLEVRRRICTLRKPRAGASYDERAALVGGDDGAVARAGGGCDLKIVRTSRAPRATDVSEQGCTVAGDSHVVGDALDALRYPFDECLALIVVLAVGQ